MPLIDWLRRKTRLNGSVKTYPPILTSIGMVQGCAITVHQVEDVKTGCIAKLQISGYLETHYIDLYPNSARELRAVLDEIISRHEQ